MPEQTDASRDKPSAAPALGPVPVAERVEVIDILRGFALCGIILVDVGDYLREPVGRADQAVQRLIDFFIEASFYPLFSFLFGLGLVIQMTRAEDRGVRFVPFYRRRLAVLLLIGLAHELLLGGNVLHDYAVLGFALLLFRRTSFRTVVVTASLVFLLASVNTSVYSAVERRLRTDTWTIQGSAPSSFEQERAERQERRLRVYAEGTYAELMRMNAGAVVAYFPHLPRALASHPFLGKVFALFLLGLYAGRRGILQNPEGHLPFLRKAMWWGFGIGFGGNFLASGLQFAGYGGLTAGIFESLANPALAAFYGCGIVFLARRAEWKIRLRSLTAIGRTALTNYVFQHFMLTVIFFGFRLNNIVGPVTGLLLCLIIVAAQIAISVLWLRHFRFGLLEWLWRSLTYGKLQPMRIK